MGSSTNEQYIVDEKGNPTAVILPIASYKKILDILDKAELVCLGGTNLTPVLNHINKTLPEISIIMTDGQYSEPSIKMKSDVIFMVLLSVPFNQSTIFVFKYTCC